MFPQKYRDVSFILCRPVLEFLETLAGGVLWYRLEINQREQVRLPIDVFYPDQEIAPILLRGGGRFVDGIQVDRHILRRPGLADRPNFGRVVAA